MNNVLVVIANEELGISVVRILKQNTALIVEHAHCEKDARSWLDHNSDCALVVVHINIPADNNSPAKPDELLGLGLVTWLTEAKPALPVILIFQVPNRILNALFGPSKKVRLVKEGVDLPERLLGAVDDSLASTSGQRDRYLT